MRYEEENPGEWQVDPKTGERFRMIGKIKEYELMVRIDGIEIPQSQLSDYHKRKKAAEEERLKKALEEAQNRPPAKSCPFANGCNTTCRRDACKIFIDGRCAISIIGDAAGVEIEEAPATDKRKCPFSIYGKCEGCALYHHGCAITRIAAAHIKNNEIEV